MKWDAYSKSVGWCREITNPDAKHEIGRRAALFAKDGDVIGVGTGSSSYVAVLELAKRAGAEGLLVTVIPAAAEISLACAENGLATTTLDAARPDWCMDGADEIGENGDVIKGRGGGLFMEKLIICAAPRRFLLADKSKFKKAVGQSPVPVEVFPAAVSMAGAALLRLGAAEVSLRLALSKDGPVITEAGNLLLDCKFDEILPGLEAEIKKLPGVIDSGLFQGYGFEYITD